MRTLLWLSLLATGCAAISANSNQSGASSAQTGNSSAQSADSSAASGTSNTSAQSSNASNASSNASNASTGSSNASAGSSAASNNSASSAQSGQSSANSSGTLQSSGQSSGTPSSSVVAGSALLLGVVGGIITTVYTVNHRRAARAEKEQLRQLQQTPVPQPMPYKVVPIPLEPAVPGQPPLPPPQGPPPPPAPEFEPAPFPGSARDELSPTIDAMVLARSWLMANELQLKQDLAIGAGPTIEDLAGIAGITPSRRAHFGRVLQRNRERLLTPHEVTPQQAAQVMSRVGDLVMADPLLRIDGEAALAAR
ncbi:MAG: DUF3015 family protein [Archangium sp.]|nr:DUF3015 family protein [Archangium sp.]MDP3575950.1 DUF3015 family protein [Archangium sp.]